MISTDGRPLADTGRFLLADTDDGDVDVLRDGKPQYRIERRERAQTDFVPTCWWQQSSPGSHFTHSTVCSRLTETGRITLSGDTLITTASGIRNEKRLPSDDAILAAYRDHFGITLDRVPQVLFPPPSPPPGAPPSPAPAAPSSPAPAAQPAPYATAPAPDGIAPTPEEPGPAIPPPPSAASDTPSEPGQVSRTP